MSLKAFHVVFIIASSALAFGCGVWEIRNALSADGRTLDWVFGIGAILAGIGLLVYERIFLKKTRDIGFL
jgi:hypothetical protein